MNTIHTYKSKEEVTMKQTETKSVIDKILTATPDQLEEIQAVMEIIMNGGTEADARAALVKMRMKHRPTMTKLEQHRLPSGFTRDQLAERSGVPVALIAGIEERKVNRAKVADLLHLAAALDTIVDELF